MNNYANTLNLMATSQIQTTKASGITKRVEQDFVFASTILVSNTSPVKMLTIYSRLSKSITKYPQIGKDVIIVVLT